MGHLSELMWDMCRCLVSSQHVLGLSVSITMGEEVGEH